MAKSRKQAQSLTRAKGTTKDMAHDTQDRLVDIEAIASETLRKATVYRRAKGIV